MSPLTIKIDHSSYDFKFPLTIFQACLLKNIFLPRFCYHIELQIAGNCRMCLVEEKSSLKPLASCAVTIINGHISYTNTESVKKAREGVLEYLLINHPLDCPICDQGGECDLQDQTMVFGADRGRFYEYKRSTPNKNFGFLIKTFLNRCIHCSRCTRFLNELSGTHEIQLLGRGLKTEIGNYISNFIKSEVSGNIIDLCPVGALTSKPYAFKSRPWELLSIYTNDILDGFGASIQLDFRGLDLMRILPRMNIHLNDEWISDRTRFSYDSFNFQRLTNSYLIFNNNYQKLNWIEVFYFIKNLFFFNKYNLDLYLNFGDFLDFETTTSFKNLMIDSSFKYLNNHINNINKDFRFFYGLKNLSFLDTSNDDIEKFNYIIINSNLRFESPILNLRLRKVFFNHENKIFILGFLSNFNFEYYHLGRKITKAALNNIIQNDKKIKFSTTPIIYFNNFNFISNNITKMIISESGMNFFKKSTNFNLFSIDSGQPEIQDFFFYSFFKINLLHHVENEYINISDSLFKLLLPVNFYFEKTTTYINNSLNFFNLTTSFSIKIPNVKPEWKIINAINELLNKKILKIFNFKDYSIGFNTSHSKNLFNIDYFDKFFKDVNKNSIINNFYSSNIITRLSNIMNLCSNTLVILNDYIYTTIK